MPKFKYTARTASKAEQSGSIEAADSQAARRQLEHDGLWVLQLAVEVDPASAGELPPLSYADALELTVQIAELAKAGLPLAAGLRAMQAELPRGRFSTAVQVLAARLEAGAPADAALTAAVSRLPTHIQGLLAAGIHSGRLAEVLQECLEQQQMQDDLRRRIWSAIAYPLVVLGLMLGWLAFVIAILVPPLADIYYDFEVELPGRTVVLLWLAGPGLRFVLTACAALALGLLAIGSCWHTYPVSCLVAEIPLVGSLWRAGNLTVFCRILATMIEQSIPLPWALRMTADGMPDAQIKVACRKLAEQVEAGQLFSDSLIMQRVFPQTLALVVRWGERLSTPSEALRAAANLFRERVELRADLLAAVIPPIAFLVVATATLWILSAMFAPLLKLMVSLS